MSPHPGQHMLLSVCLMIAILVGVKYHLTVVLICISLMAVIMSILSCAYSPALILLVTASYKLMVTTMDPDESSTQKYLLTCAMSILSPEARKIFGPCLSDLQSRRKEKKT